MVLHQLSQRSLEAIKAGKINDEGLTTKTSDAQVTFRYEEIHRPFLTLNQIIRGHFQLIVEKRCREIFEKCEAFLSECNGDLEEAIVHEVLNTCG
jgi:hypothetical protein